MERIGPPRLADVAAMTGVSINTVSRAIRAPQTVRPQLLSRIHAAMDELNYVPNQLAGGLAGSRNDIVGVVLTSLFYSEFAPIVDAMQEVLAAAGLRVMLANSNYDPQEELKAVRSMLSWRPAALALVGVDHDQRAQDLIKSAAIPVVEFWESGAEPIDSVVGMDHRQIGALQTQHLLSRGYKQPAFIGCVRPHDYRAQRRRDGYRQYCADQHIEPLEATLPQAGTPDLGEQLALDLLRNHPETDALVCNSDIIAMGAMRGLKAKAIKVPHQIGIIGFGDNEAAACLAPALSTIRPPRRDIGRKVAEVLLARTAGGEPSQHHFTADLVTRATCHGPKLTT